ncbi:hypothetical protein QRD40_23600 [Comamonas sp. Y6]|uniref:Uncharacterized protein n=1 Tax=Comamonas resistens TaxID=3046670 RepID=A0ABY8T1K5_9BURK|nr:MULTISPECIES: hypothetical protein [Comamonadaceae]MDL5039320.1 hypothetical protein [Comamonas resistens]WHS68104.1 hypothetical protein QMY55_24655 [Comamonas resistens]GAD21792.1 hypothetical protein AVS7_01552 [Acidovorax sp. MR-S7]
MAQQTLTPAEARSIFADASAETFPSARLTSAGRAAVADWLTSTAKPASINQSEWLAQWYDDIESRASFGEQPIAVEVRASTSVTGTPQLLTLDDSYFEWCIEK